MKRFVVDVDGFMPEVFVAETKPKAFYAAYRKFVEAWPCSFADWLRKARVYASEWPVLS